LSAALYPTKLANALARIKYEPNRHAAAIRLILCLQNYRVCESVTGKVDPGLSLRNQTRVDLSKVFLRREVNFLRQGGLGRANGGQNGKPSRDELRCWR
jgi:hypothetical protein